MEQVPCDSDTNINIYRVAEASNDPNYEPRFMNGTLQLADSEVYPSFPDIPIKSRNSIERGESRSINLGNRSQASVSQEDVTEDATFICEVRGKTNEILPKIVEEEVQYEPDESEQAMELEEAIQDPGGPLFAFTSNEAALFEPFKD